jgi:hypothetical protein
MVAGIAAVFTAYDVNRVVVGYSALEADQVSGTVLMTAGMTSLTIAGAILIHSTRGRVSRGVVRLYAWLVLVWVAAMLVVFAVTHRMLGLRHFFDPGKMDTPVKVALLNYITVVFAAPLIAIITAPWWWRRTREQSHDR